MKDVQREEPERLQKSESGGACVTDPLKGESISF